MDERELKAVVPDPDQLRAALKRAGGVAGFAGMMTDRRFDRDSELLVQDQVLRVRRYESTDRRSRVRITWKGPVRVDRGYKLRPEIEVEAGDGSGAPKDLIAALGYRTIQRIDRYVEYYTVAGATARLEWYPRMDVLLEVEGGPDAIEAAIRATGLEREAFTADALPVFVASYERRTGRRAAISVDELEGDPPSWPAR